MRLWFGETLIRIVHDQPGTGYAKAMLFYGLFFLGTTALVVNNNLFAGILIGLFFVPLAAFVLLLAVVAVLAPYSFHANWITTVSRLNGELRTREAQQDEARQVIDRSKRYKRIDNTSILKGRIDWRVIDVDSEGKRMLIKPLFSNRTHALIGEDPVSGEAFFIAVPPSVPSVPHALAWLYDLPVTFWGSRDEIYET